MEQGSYSGPKADEGRNLVNQHNAELDREDILIFKEKSVPGQPPRVARVEMTSHALAVMKARGILDAMDEIDAHIEAMHLVRDTSPPCVRLRRLVYV
jgi:hypothetical protein